MSLASYLHPTKGRGGWGFPQVKLQSLGGPVFTLSLIVPITNTGHHDTHTLEPTQLQRKIRGPR